MERSPENVHASAIGPI